MRHDARSLLLALGVAALVALFVMPFVNRGGATLLACLGREAAFALFGAEEGGGLEEARVGPAVVMGEVVEVGGSHDFAS